MVNKWSGGKCKAPTLKQTLDTRKCVIYAFMDYGLCLYGSCMLLNVFGDLTRGTAFPLLCVFMFFFVLSCTMVPFFHSCTMYSCSVSPTLMDTTVFSSTTTSRLVYSKESLLVLRNNSQAGMQHPVPRELKRLGGGCRAVAQTLSEAILDVYSL